MENVIFDINEILKELRNRQQKQGIYTQEGWNELIDEIIEEKITASEISEDRNIESLRQQLRERWDDFGKGSVKIEE
jgi:hypothetical protein